MKISPNHPRAQSLLIREKIVKGVELGLTSLAGLTAHGRGEAFDYLIDEKTHQFSLNAIKAAAAYLLLSKHPVLSINGNTAALTAYEFIKLAKVLNCKIETNLFHHSRKRVKTINKYLKKFDKEAAYDSESLPITVIPNIESDRKIVLKDGIAQSDVVLVPLEDGDRCQSLKLLGKKVITIDLNPLSRTARSATVTIIDNIIRSMPQLVKKVKSFRNKNKDELSQIIKNYNNSKTLNQAMKTIQNRLNSLKRRAK